MKRPDPFISANPYPGPGSYTLNDSSFIKKNFENGTS